MRELVWDLEADNVQVIMAPGVTDVSSERIRVRPVGGLPLLHLDRPRSQDALRWAKRTFDIVGSAALLLLCGPGHALDRVADQAATTAGRCCSGRPASAATATTSPA